MKKIFYLFLTITMISCGGDDDGNSPDTTPPVITLIGDSNVTLIQGENYIDQGATATDNVDGDLSDNIEVSGQVNSAVIGNYVLNYSVSDAAGNTASVDRNVSVIDDGNPVYLSDNGITIKAKEWAQVGDSGEVNGVVYSIVNELELRNLVTSNANFSGVCTSLIQDMSSLFADYDFSNNDSSISSWDVSQVTTMNNMFFGSNTFNQDISYWDVGAVTDMGGMFDGATLFNADLSTWNVSQVTNMVNMFHAAEAFNAEIGNWDVSNVTNMTQTFKYASVFNANIDLWNVSSVNSMDDMFVAAYAFNSPLNSWDVSNVTSMTRMFLAATSFDQPLNNWDVSGVFQMEEMFDSCVSYNQDLSSWQVDAVENCVCFSCGASNWTLPKPNFTNCVP